MHLFKCFLISIVFTLSFLNISFAEDLNSPFGEWITISDKTQERAGMVKLYERDGKLNGIITKIFPGKNRNPNDKCLKCPDSFKNKPVLGLEFLWGFVRQPDGSWKEGQILDPKEGKIYRGSIKLSNNGKQLELRGYWGPFWRTQHWIRATE